MYAFFPAKSVSPNCQSSQKMVFPKSGDSLETVQRQSRDISETVQRQSRYSLETVQRQSRDSPETVQRQFRGSPETVQRQSRDSPDTVQRHQSSIISHCIDCLPLEQGWISQTSKISNYDHRPWRQRTDDNIVTGTPVKASLRNGLKKEFQKIV